MFANGYPIAASAEWWLLTPHSCMKHCIALFVCLSLALSLLHDTNHVLYICRECPRAQHVLLPCSMQAWILFFFLSLSSLFSSLLVRDERLALTIQPGSPTYTYSKQLQCSSSNARLPRLPAQPAFEQLPNAPHPKWRNSCLGRKEQKKSKRKAKRKDTARDDYEQTRHGRKVGF
ncbi:hypothetical protein GGI43DRAFT_418649 [Trichoderma evansii]